MLAVGHERPAGLEPVEAVVEGALAERAALGVGALMAARRQPEVVDEHAPADGQRDPRRRAVGGEVEVGVEAEGDRHGDVAVGVTVVVTVSPASPSATDSSTSCGNGNCSRRASSLHAWRATSVVSLGLVHGPVGRGGEQPVDRDAVLVAAAVLQVERAPAELEPALREAVGPRVQERDPEGRAPLDVGLEAALLAEQLPALAVSDEQTIPAPGTYVAASSPARMTCGSTAPSCRPLAR